MELMHWTDDRLDDLKDSVTAMDRRIDHRLFKSTSDSPRSTSDSPS
jgi:hypothetical protein